MTIHDATPEDHPWYLDLRPDPSCDGYDGDAAAALRALDAIGAVVLAVHADTLPSLADLVAGRSYIGWTMLVPGSVGHDAIAAIAATAGAGYRVTIAPGHPLPPTTDGTASPPAHRSETRNAAPRPVPPSAQAHGAGNPAADRRSLMTTPSSPVPIGGRADHYAGHDSNDM